jgi:hypothetical protein
MKRIFSLRLTAIALAVATLAASCEKKLEEVVPQTTLPRSAVLTDPNAALSLYQGVYANFRGFHGTLFTFGELRSDIWADGIFTESADGTAVQYSTFNFNQSNAPAGNWGGFYSLLDKINTVIDLFPQAPLDDATRKRCIAEMYGMRAYVYYTMLRTWGGVPITSTPVTAVGELTELYRERSSEADVMKLIKEDIEQSLTLFGTTHTFSGKRVYWNRAASLTLKGDVYLWSGTNMGGSTADFTTARTALEELTTLPAATLGLQPVYADIFDPTKETNNREIIFGISFELNEATHGAYGNITVNTTQASTLIFDPPPAPVRTRVDSAYPLVAGASRIGMNSAMLTRLASTTDTRIRASYRTMHRTTTGFPVAGVMLVKFIGRVNAGAQLYDNNFPVYRYADVLLLLAEAKAKLGGDPSTEINAIRQRAYGSGFTPYTDGSTDADLTAILEEGLREFIGEGRRWWALRRAGDSFVFANIRSTYLSQATKHKYLLPITTSMLNGDPKLTQTPGY